jgi:hypothetical protein
MLKLYFFEIKTMGFHPKTLTALTVSNFAKAKSAFGSRTSLRYIKVRP